MGISKTKEKNKKKNRGISFKLRLIECAVFALIFVLCAVHGVVINTSVSRAEGEGTLTLEDYLLSGDTNVFVEELRGYKDKRDRAYGVMWQLEDISSKFVLAEDSLSDYIYQGDTMTVNAGNVQTGGAEIRLVHGERYMGVDIAILEDTYEAAVLVYNEAKRNYDELAMIYGGFAVVGYNAGNGFAVDVKENELFGNATWDALDESLYGSGMRVPAVEEEDEKPSAVEKYIAKPIGNGAWTLYKWMYKWDIDLTIDGLVYGRMASSYKGTADFTHFGLENNNPYGIVGATAYYVLRRIFLGVLPIALIIMLIVQLFRNTNRGRAQLKDMATSFLLVIALMFAFPYALNFVIYVRDVVLKATSVGMTTIFKGVGFNEFSVGGSIIGMLYSVYSSSKTLLNALLLAAGVGSGFFYFATYVKAAVLITGCFAILPLILFISIWNKKLLKDWWNIFFPNMCVPLIDLILLQIPTIVLLVYRKVGGSGSIVIGILLMVIMWISITIRDRIVKLLGFDGFGGRNGLGLLAGAMMAMRQFGGGRSGDSREGADRRLPGGREFLTNELESENEARQFSQMRAGIMEQMQNDSFDIPLGENISFDYGLGSKTEQFLSDMDEYAGGIKDSAAASDADVEGVAVPDDVSFVDGFSGSADDYYQPSDIPVYQAEAGDIPDMSDAAFRDSLSEPVDIARFDNLASMDSYYNEIAKNEATMLNAGYHGQKAYEAERAGYMEQIDRLNTHIDESNVRLFTRSDIDSPEFAMEKQKLSESLELKRNLSERVGQLDHAAGLDKANAVYRERVEACKRREVQYAKDAGYSGMKNTVYESSRDFMYQHKIDSARRELANFKNFDTKRYEGLLSHQERESFYREREIYRHRQKIANVAEKATKVAVGAAGIVGAGAVASFAAYGGASASSLGAVGAYKAFSKVQGASGNFVGRTGERIVERSMNRRPDKQKTTVRTMPTAEPVVHFPSQSYYNAKTSEREALNRLRQRANLGISDIDNTRSRERAVLGELKERAQKGLD